jgi:hypothetical protein
MSGLPAGTIGVEYTVATGPFFPTNSSVASSTSAATTATSVTSGATVGATFPLNPTIGQQFYNTQLAGLYVWTGATWAHA